MYQDEESLKLLIQRYEQRIFALVLYLIGGDCDKAYDVTASIFEEAIRTKTFSEKGDIFLARLADIAIQMSREVKAVPSSDEPDLIGLSAEEKKTLGIIKSALQRLPFEMRALLLLRDQLHLSYKDIATVFRTSERKAKIQTTQSRLKLRKKIEEVLKDALQ